jgi:hypothetical protein
VRAGSGLRKKLWRKLRARNECMQQSPSDKTNPTKQVCPAKTVVWASCMMKLFVLVQYVLQIILKQNQSFLRACIIPVHLSQCILQGSCCTRARESQLKNSSQTGQEINHFQACGAAKSSQLLTLEQSQTGPKCKTARWTCENGCSSGIGLQGPPLFWRYALVRQLYSSFVWLTMSVFMTN